MSQSSFYSLTNVVVSSEMSLCLTGPISPSSSARKVSPRRSSEGSTNKLQLTTSRCRKPRSLLSRSQLASGAVSSILQQVHSKAPLLALNTCSVSRSRWLTWRMPPVSICARSTHRVSTSASMTPWRSSMLALARNSRDPSRRALCVLPCLMLTTNGTVLRYWQLRAVVRSKLSSLTTETLRW